MSLVPIARHLEELRQAVGERLLWSPLDFIRGLSAEGDRRRLLALLFAAWDAERDLRFLHEGPGGRQVVIAEKLAWDSAFFGYPVARLHGIYPASGESGARADPSAPLDAFVARAEERGIRYLFSHVDPRDLALLRALAEAGFALIETRLYYHMRIADYASPERYPVRLATADDVAGLAETARTMTNAFDRFHADPFVDPGDADRLMVRWVEASINEAFADATIVPDVERPTAFCTARYHREAWPDWGLKLAQPVFSAVSPEFKGWYRKLISELNHHFKEAGAEHTYLITQVTNNAVIHAWETIGYRFGKAEHVFRRVLDA